MRSKKYWNVYKGECRIEVYQYAHGDKKVNKNFPELIKYINRNKIVLTHNQTAVSGRAWEELKVGDILISESGNKMTIERVSVYGNDTDFISRGMMCLIVAEVTRYEDLKQWQVLFSED